MLLLVLPVAIQAQHQIKNSVLGNASAPTSGASHQVVGTLGQPVIGITGDQTNVTKSGFWEQAIDFVTSIEEMPNQVVPKEFRLEQNYPNPFNPSTTIQFAVPQQAIVSLKLFDLLGREIATLIEEDIKPGAYKLTFKSDGLPSGIYFYQFRSDGFVETKRLTLLK
jgi:hypothetical protein